MIEEKPKKMYRVKFLKFEENRRPPYYGTWRKKSSKLGPRRPFAQDTVSSLNSILLGSYYTQRRKHLAKESTFRCRLNSSRGLYNDYKPLLKSYRKVAMEFCTVFVPLNAKYTLRKFDLRRIVDLIRHL